MNILQSARSLAPTLAILAAAAAQDPITIAPPAVGAAATFAYHSSQHQQIDMGGQQLEVKLQLDQEFRVEVTAAGDDGSRTAKVTLLKVVGQYEVPGPDEPIAFDSSKKDDSADGLQAAAQVLAGKDFTAKIDLEGKVTLDGFAATQKAARDAAGTDAQWVDGIITDRAIAGLVRLAFGPIPKAPVADGAKWQRTEETGAQLPVMRTLECTLTKHDADSAAIGITGKIESVPGQKAGPMGETKVENGKIEGSAVMSRKDGFTTSAAVKASLTIIAGGGQAEVQVTIDTTIARATDKPAAGKETPAEPHKDDAKTPNK